MLKLNPSSEASSEEPSPSGVAVIARIFLFAAAYLIVVGLLLLSKRLSPMFGAPVLTGLEQAGPYMFLLTGVTAALTGWDLLRLDSWGRWAAILVSLFGLVMLVPGVSMAVIQLNPVRLAAGGAGIIVRSAVLWYLFQEPVRERFR
jgi:hypothetical protein